MTEETIIKVTEKLVDITIEKHMKKILGKEKMFNFIKNNLNKDITEYEYNMILHLYSKYLAKKGYEIKNDINKFDIINYNSEEYNTKYNNYKK